MDSKKRRCHTKPSMAVNGYVRRVQIIRLSESWLHRGGAWYRRVGEIEQSGDHFARHNLE